MEQVSRVVLDAPVRTPQGAVAALCRLTGHVGPRLDARASGRRVAGLLGAGDKVPLALLVMTGQEVRCLALDGRRMPEEEA